MIYNDIANSHLNFLSQSQSSLPLQLSLPVSQLKSCVPSSELEGKILRHFFLF